MLQYKMGDIKGALHYNKGARSAVVQGEAYEIARAGGRHGAFYQIYVRRRSEEIRRGIRSLERRIQEHEEKIRHPEQGVRSQLLAFGIPVQELEPVVPELGQPALRGG